MREIKFRAWDKEHNLMIWFYELEADYTAGFWRDSGPQGIMKGSEVDNYRLQTTRIADDIGGYNHSDFNESVDVELMQYTGLKDKNGVEIYEGDILLVPNHPTMSDPMGESDFCEVVYDSGAFGYRQGGMIETFCSLYGHGTEKTDEEEVIGNIYENPELLKEIGEEDGS